MRSGGRHKRELKNPRDGGSPAEEALRLIKAGMHPVPLPFQKKGPEIPNWPALRIGKNEVSEWFNGKRQNIGVILGIDGLADLDLDCREAIAAANELLPPTDFVFGRASKPRAHRLYRLDHGVKTKQFKDPVAGSVLLEVRCLKSDDEVGFETMVPPSIHPSGEPVRYDTRGEPAEVKADDLLCAARQTAAAALITHHFPVEQGGRNQTFLALVAPSRTLVCRWNSRSACTGRFIGFCGMTRRISPRPSARSIRPTANLKPAKPSPASWT